MFGRINASAGPNKKNRIGKSRGLDKSKVVAEFEGKELNSGR